MIAAKFDSDNGMFKANVLLYSPGVVVTGVARKDNSGTTLHPPHGGLPLPSMAYVVNHRHRFRTLYSLESRENGVYSKTSSTDYCCY